MKDKKHNYQSDILALPPLKMVLNDNQETGSDEKHHFTRALGKDKSEAEARNIVTKLIGHLKNNDQ